jgi:AAA domain
MTSGDEVETLDEFYWKKNNPPTGNADKAPTAKDWRTRVFDAAGLHSQTFAEVKYVIPNLIPEGVSILAGRPKIGKSWMALDLALTRALKPPSFCLGNLEPLHGDVLYCALEDNPRRLQRRIARILSSRDVPWPERLHLANEWRRLGGGGVNDLREWAESVPNPVLIILDTLAGVRPERRGLESVYDGDYRALAEIHTWANKIGIAVVVLHHTRKMEADDPLDSISGSLGLAGCADTSLVLNRTSQGTTLYLRGRDVEEAEHAVSFDPLTCRWTIMGDAAEIHRSESRGAVLAVLEDATETMSPAEIASAACLPKNNVDQQLYRMGKTGEVTKLARGRYAASSRADLIGGHRNRKDRKERSGYPPKLTLLTKPTGGTDAAV